MYILYICTYQEKGKYLLALFLYRKKKQLEEASLAAITLSATLLRLKE